MVQMAHLVQAVLLLPWVPVLQGDQYLLFVLSPLCGPAVPWILEDLELLDDQRHQ